MAEMAWIAAGLLGLAFGSFATVLIGRVPSKKSIVSPGSACPVCETPIAWYDNIPVISYLALRSRCRSCGSRISVRYPVVEISNAVLWIAMTVRFGLSWTLPAYLAFATTLLVLSAIDFEHHRLPNRILGPASIIAIILLTVAGATSSDWNSILLAFAGAAAFGVPMLLLALAVPRGMGIGDVKLAGYLGLHLGWLSLWNVLVGAMAGFFIGGVAGIVLLIAGRKGRKDPVPFGPSMAAGALIAVFLGKGILELWLGL